LLAVKKKPPRPFAHNNTPLCRPIILT
jgi:hypothetical protein